MRAIKLAQMRCERHYWMLAARRAHHHRLTRKLLGVGEIETGKIIDHASVIGFCSSTRVAGSRRLRLVLLRSWRGTGTCRRLLCTHSDRQKQNHRSQRQYSAESEKPGYFLAKAHIETFLQAQARNPQ